MSLGILLCTIVSSVASLGYVYVLEYDCLPGSLSTRLYCLLYNFTGAVPTLVLFRVDAQGSPPCFRACFHRWVDVASTAVFSLGLRILSLLNGQRLVDDACM